MGMSHPGSTATMIHISVVIEILVPDSLTQLYEQVPGSAYTIILESQLVTSLGCANISLNETQQFQVKVNDIIGACIIDNSTLNSLYIVGSLRTGGLYRSNSFSLNSLSCEGLDPINTDLLSKRDVHTLHLSINIGMVGSQGIYWEAQGGSFPPNPLPTK